MLKKSGSFPTMFQFCALLIPSGPRKKAAKFPFLKVLSARLKGKSSGKGCA